MTNDFDLGGPMPEPAKSEAKTKAEAKQQKGKAEEALEIEEGVVQARINNAVAEVAKRNSELSSKVSELEGSLEKQKQLNINLDAALKEARNKEQSLSQEELLDLLHKTSLDERQQKILDKYKDAIKQFDKDFQGEKFKKDFEKWLTDRVEQKLMAMKKK
jgi:hypothetical protein